MAFLLAFLIFLFTPAHAEVPTAIQNVLKTDHPQIKFRIDDMAQLRDQVWLLTKPVANKEVNGEILLVEKTQDQDYLFSNGWIYTPIKDNTIKSYDYYPKSFQEILLASNIHQGFLIPKSFTLPRDLAMLAGRLPLELSSVELATEREILYKERLKEEEKNKPFEFLAYTLKSGEFNSIKIGHNDKNSIESVEIKTNEKLSESINYASKIKKFDDGVYISDQNKGKIFKIKNRSREDVFDASRPLLTQNLEEMEASYELEEVLDLANFIEEKNGIKDFSFNKSKTNAYVLTFLDSKLHIIDTRKKTIIKSIELPASADGMKLISRSVSEPDKLVFSSKSGSKVFMLNTFDYRISSVLELNKISETYRFIPHDLLVTKDYVLVAVEALYKSPKMLSESMGKILVLDPITGKLLSSIDIAFTPYYLTFTNDKKYIFTVGNNFKSKTFISKINPKELKVIKTSDLSPDIIDAKSISASPGGNFILVPSEASNQVGVVDIESNSLVKKLDLATPTSFILAL